MKKIIFLWTVLNCGLAAAQTNAPPVAPTNTPATNATNAAPRPPMEIHSETAVFDQNARLVVYSGHVTVDDPQMKLTCDRLVAFVPPSGERLNHIEAQTNVVMDFDNHGQPARATGALAVYRYGVVSGTTNELVTLTGSPQVDSPQGTVTGTEIVWDFVNKRLSGTSIKMVPKQNPKDAGGTNASPLKLF